MAHNNTRTVLIPARGGSKRLPRKNVLPFLGKPMLTWTIECAQASELFDTIHVSTEDEEIGRIAEESGGVWIHRPKMLAGDRITVAQVCEDFLNREENAGRSHEILVVLYPAAPLRTPDDIRQVVRLVEEDSADFALTAREFPYDPCEALVVHQDATAVPWQPELFAKPRQDRPVLRIDAGSVYAVRVSEFRSIGDFFGPNTKVVEVPPERAVDIDTAEDLARTEFYASWFSKRRAV